MLQKGMMKSRPLRRMREPHAVQSAETWMPTIVHSAILPRPTIVQSRPPTGVLSQMKAPNPVKYNKMWTNTGHMVTTYLIGIQYHMWQTQGKTCPLCHMRQSLYWLHEGKTQHVGGMKPSALNNKKSFSSHALISLLTPIQSIHNACGSHDAPIKTIMPS